VSVEAIFGNVQPRPTEPFYIELLEIPFHHMIPGAVPIKMTGDFSPELLRMFNASAIGFPIIVDASNAVHNDGQNSIFRLYIWPLFTGIC
jgi:hypothetical protein